MLDSQQLSVAEFFWVAVLVALMGRELLQARIHPRRIEIFRPTIIVGVVLAYYALVGPLRAVALGDWLERGVDRRADLIWGWAGAAVFYASTLVGFHLLGTPRLDRRRSAPATLNACTASAPPFASLACCSSSLCQASVCSPISTPLSQESCCAVPPVLRYSLGRELATISCFPSISSSPACA